MNDTLKNDTNSTTPEASISSDLLACPFCGGGVEMEYDPVTSYIINCCVTMSLQICDALDDAGKRWEPIYGYDHPSQEYPECSQSICRDQLRDSWNSRANAHGQATPSEE